MDLIACYASLWTKLCILEDETRGGRNRIMVEDWVGNVTIALGLLFTPEEILTGLLDVSILNCYS